MTTTIRYIDFEPQILSKSLWTSYTFETMDAVLERANEWIRRNYNTEIINVETVVLPNIYKKDERLVNQVIKYQTGGTIVHNFQIIRIWYKG